MIACLRKYFDGVELLTERNADLFAKDCVSGIHMTVY